MFIEIKGAKENNLKNIDVSIPKKKLIVFTGLSGSGKSTLAMETLQRECQRQYMDSLGMTMEIGSKPKVDSIEGLSPAISISQRQTTNNPRSTVGTVTDISPYLRVLFSKLGVRPCPHCGKLIEKKDSQEEEIEYFESNEIEVESEEQTEQETICPHCGKEIPELTPSHFSFNKPQGACPLCRGIGVINTPDIDLIIDKNKSVEEFAIHGWDQVYVDRYGNALRQAAKHYGFTIDTSIPIKQYDSVQMDLLLYGVLSKQFISRFPHIKPPKTVPEGRFEGVVTNLMRRYTEKSTTSARQKMEKLFNQQICPECNGIRFKPGILEVRVGNANIQEATQMSLIETRKWLLGLKEEVSKEAYAVVSNLVDELVNKLQRIINAGAGYLQLNQPSSSLSAGEWQRVKLASILGSGLTDVLYVLDEPTSGLHPRDTKRIIQVLKELRDKGNTVIAIEHDLDVIRESDYIFDFGPGAGKQGGTIVAHGTAEQIMACENSITGQYLKKHDKVKLKSKMEPSKYFLEIENACVNNLKKVNTRIPLERFVCVTGVSGSGKSSLVFGFLAEAAQNYFSSKSKCKDVGVKGLDNINDVIVINEQAIGRSSRSNVATYTDVFSNIRDIFAALPETKVNKLTAKHFSYNATGGRCEKCQGSGTLQIPMHFLPDVEVTCPVCGGKRYKKKILQIKYKGYSISDILQMSIDEAVSVFADEKKVLLKLKILQDVGLGYLGLGQSTVTLSGGEAQRLKLAKELSKGGDGRSLYLFDEPTTGLHPHDAARLIQVFRRLVEKGNSIIAIEHNPDMIAASDWIIDMGPEGGNEGGNIVVEGTLSDIVKCKESHTGRILSSIVQNDVV